MSGYSQDLRERIVRSKAEGGALEWIAQTFGVSVSTVKRYWARYQQTGSVAATVQRTQQPRLHAGYDEQLIAQVERLTDATLQEHVEEWERTMGMKVSVPSMCRALQRLKQTRKKDIRRE